MAGLTLDYSYRYARPSAVDWTDGRAQLSLSTSGIAAQPDTFFRGSLTRPRMTADLLLALVRVVQSRYHMPAAMLAKIIALSDPVVTCGEDRIRFEGFSACCGVYGRVDLLPEGVNGSLVNTGTTNVDFNPPMRAALARLRETEPAGLTVGAGAVELEARGETVVERKVKLPVRWLKGFVEVQAHQSRMEPRFEVNGTEARRFVQSLPRQGSNSRAAWVTRSGSGLRLSMIESKGSVRVSGVERLRILEDIVRHARSLTVYASSDSEASGWEITTDIARFHLVISPETWRGFSGEGQALGLLAGKISETSLERVRGSLDWQPRVDVGGLSQTCALEPTDVRAALARLGARGLVGYDLAEGAYFHRELPFDLELVEHLQPRLKDARKLVAENGVQVAVNSDELIEGWVRGTGCEHHVRIVAGDGRCSCPWFAKHPGDRGPCKHILAVQIVAGGADDA